VGALDLPRYLAPLDRLVALRPLLGVRTVAQTLMKLVDPLGCERRAVGVFHAPYLASTAAALATLGRAGLCVQALGGLPEAAPGKIVRVCRTGAEPETLDLRALPAFPSERSDAAADREDAAALNRAALDGADAPLARAAAAAALLLHAARGGDPLAAAADARRVFISGAARAVALGFVIVELHAPLSPSSDEHASAPPPSPPSAHTSAFAPPSSAAPP